MARVKPKPTDSSLRRLERAARGALAHSYSPYSKFRVAAAVLAGSGKVYSGCNVENASYGLCNCAERTAIFSAVAAGERSIRAVMVYTPTPLPTAPCGACRQVMYEFADKNTALYLVDLNPSSGRRTLNKTTVFKMLPMAFDPLASGLLPQNPRNLLNRKNARSRARGK